MTVPRNALETTAAVNAPEKDVRASAQALIAERVHRSQLRSLKLLRPSKLQIQLRQRHSAD